jgi:multiple sugar transport system permease protein
MIFKRLNRQKFGFLPLLLPGVIVLVLVTLYPTAYGVWLSLSKLTVGGRGAATFVGFKNYIQLLVSQEFRESLQATIIFVSGSVIFSFLVGLLLAIFLNRQFRGRTIYMALFILPVVATPVVSGMMWKFMLSAQFGVVNYLLSLVGIPEYPWLSKPVTAMAAVILVDVWQWSPFVMYLMLAAIGSLSREIEEAAIVDGASRFQLWVQINMPQLIPAAIAVLLFRIIDAFKAFDTILIMTMGGPGRTTQVLNLTAYMTGFRFFDLGKAAALGMISLVLVVVISQSLTKTLQRGA